MNQRSFRKLPSWQTDVLQEDVSTKFLLKYFEFNFDAAADARNTLFCNGCYTLQVQMPEKKKAVGADTGRMVGFGVIPVGRFRS
ncbi:unnamed protein product, partial [Iphiclides podalirius]